MNFIKRICLYLNIFFQEIETWRDIVLNHDTPPSNVKNTLKAFQFSGLENVKTNLKILGTIPITLCECERSCLGMRRLVNFCRTAMLEEILNGLNPEGKKVIDKYRRQNDPTERQKNRHKQS